MGFMNRFIFPWLRPIGSSCDRNFFEGFDLDVDTRMDADTAVRAQQAQPYQGVVAVPSLSRRNGGLSL